MNRSLGGNFLEQSPTKGFGPNRLSGTGYGSNFGSGQPPIDGNFLSENSQPGPSQFQDHQYASQQFGGSMG